MREVWESWEEAQKTADPVQSLGDLGQHGREDCSRSICEKKHFQATRLPFMLQFLMWRPQPGRKIRVLEATRRGHLAQPLSLDKETPA